MESVNTFQAGMNLDINPLNQPKGTYREANNIRIINDVGGTSASINNIKGNEFNITIPDTPVFQKISIIANEPAQQLTITGSLSQTGLSFNTEGMTLRDLYDYIYNSGAYTLLDVEYNIYYGNSYLLIVPIGGSTITMSVIGSGLFLNTSATPTYFIPAQTGLEIIGSVNIREDVYLFTTNNKTKNPGGHNSSLAIDPSSVGQIWKYEYDKITLSGSLKLIYNNYVDFTTYQVIAPTAATGRYENKGIQRIYWTDFFNKLRTINVVDPNSLAIDVSALDIVPSLETDIPILQTLSNSSSSSIKVGAYQASYRLKNTGGAVTNFSELSNIVYVCPQDEASQTNSNSGDGYYGGSPGSGVNKRITWKIDNLDQDYDRIEIAIAFRQNIADPATITIIHDDPLGGDSYTFAYDGSEEGLPLTLSEFLKLSGAFTHCKTIGTKDNRLFVGNIRNELSEIIYDSRAYRWYGINQLSLVENGVSNPYELSTLENIVETSDAINPDQDINKYQADGATLGGQGLNISYKFKTIAISVDKDTKGIRKFEVSDCVSAPWRGVSPRYFGPTNVNLNVFSPNNDLGSDIQEYPSPFIGSNDGIKYPHISGLYRGYQRTETYRFGIQFFDKSKNPYFVKWIGDIKFPDFDDVNTQSFYEDGSPTGITDFRLSFTARPNGGYYEAFVQSLGIDFTISNLDSIADQISGYSIVRLKRKVQDRTVVCQGYITPVDIYDGGSSADDAYHTTSPALDSSGNTPWGWSGITYAQRGWFSTPEVSILSVSPDTTMKLKVKTHLHKINTKIGNSSGGTNPYYMYKLYNSITYTTPRINIKQITYVGYAGNTIDEASGLAVNNYDFGLFGASGAESQSIGNAAFYFVLDNIISWPTLGKYLVNIERTLSNQYNGNSYSDRANNTYMSCGIFNPTRIIFPGTVYNPTVFGGDTFVNLYDSCRWAKNFGNSGRAVAEDKYSTTFYYPVESVINTDLRSGRYMNKDFGDGAPNPCALSDGSNYETEFVENYYYNSVYSTENDIKEYFPKPDPFILNDEFDNRFYNSEIKINGEHTDSWGTFLTNNYWDVEGTYGPINAMEILKDRMYFWQTRAFGIIQINPRAIITDVGNIGNSELEIGTGLALQRHDYLSTELGLQHQWGLTKSNYKLFWLDVNNRKFYSFGGENIEFNSDAKGLFSYLNDNLEYNILTTDKPAYYDSITGVNGVRTVYDFKYNQAIFTISDNKNINAEPVLSNAFTLVFDERMGAFSSFYSHTPRIYFSDGYIVFSTDPNNLSDIYMHDEGDYGRFYGTLNDSTIKLITNENFGSTKVFDNIVWDSQSTELDANGTRTNFNDDTWNTIRAYNDYQNTDIQILNPNVNIKRKERTWQLAIPRNRVLYTSSDSPNIFTDLSPSDKVMGERMRDKYLTLDLSYSNTDNRLLSTNNIKFIYRQSPR
jgi:hypothetical protein